MVACPECGEQFDMLGQHWNRSSCSYPTLTKYQYQVATGILMGDASINNGSKHPLLQISMITPSYLNYLDNVFGILSTGVRKENRTTSTGNKIYRLNTRSLPHIKEFKQWYNGGEKSWPESIELTPTVLKHLYVCDGDLDTNGSAYRIRISMSNERNNKSKVEQMFSSAGFDIKRWDESERKNGGYRCSAVFDKQTTVDMLEYMGEPLPGFGYKWGEKASPQ